MSLAVKDKTAQHTSGAPSKDASRLDDDGGRTKKKVKSRRRKSVEKKQKQALRWRLRGFIRRYASALLLAFNAPFVLGGPLWHLHLHNLRPLRPLRLPLRPPGVLLVPPVRLCALCNDCILFARAFQQPSKSLSR
mmetsp:Transcript_1275/g.3653  ORF Transcript_1275/g.3653 Transcript_1275/m.3653 type:complete len:135 (+) Transcript_1275:343-747(+)